MGLGVYDTKAYRGKERRELRVHFFNRFFRGDRVKITFENGHVEYGHFHEIVNERDFHGGRFKIDGTKDARLKNNRYAIIVMGEGARIKGFLPGLITDTHIILRDSGMKLYNEVILLQPIGDFRFGSMGNFEKRRKFTRIHQHVLIYSKGEPYISDLAA